MALPHVISDKVLKGERAGQALQQNFEELDSQLKRLTNLGNQESPDFTFPNFFDLSIDTAPVAPDAGTLRVFVEDNGAGKARLVVMDTNGVKTTLATET